MFSGAENRGVGAPVSGSPLEALNGGGEPTARDILGPDTPEGQSIWLMVAGLAILFLAVGGGGSILGRAKGAGQWLLLVAASMIVVNWTARYYALGHPERPFAAGVQVNLG